MEPNRVNKPYKIKYTSHCHMVSNWVSMCDISVHTDTTVASGKSHEAKVNKDTEAGNQ